MKTRMFRVVFCWLIAVWMFIPLLSHGQGNEVSGLLQTLAEPNAQISNWDRTATIMIFLNVAVGVLGLVTGLFQSSKKRWCKIGTAIAGFIISAIIVINNTVFDVDYRVLRERSREGRTIVSDLTIMINRGVPPDGDSRAAWFDEYGKKLHEFHDLEKQHNELAVNFHLSSTVYAQSSESINQKPSWISKPPEDPTNLYFLGVGDSPSLAKARGLSQSDAVNRAVDYISSRFQSTQQNETAPVDTAALSQYLVKSAEPAGVYFDFDPNSRTYRYYTLLRIHKDFVETDLKLFALQRKASVPQQFAASVNIAQSAYPSRSRPVILGEYKVFQRHVKKLDALEGKVAVYVGDVHRARPARVVIFALDQNMQISEADPVGYDTLKGRLNSRAILLDRRISDNEQAQVTVNHQESIFTFNYQRQVLGDDYATVRLLKK